MSELLASQMGKPEKRPSEGHQSRGPIAISYLLKSCLPVPAQSRAGPWLSLALAGSGFASTYESYVCPSVEEKLGPAFRQFQDLKPGEK